MRLPLLQDFAAVNRIILTSKAFSVHVPRQARAPFNVTGHPALAMMAGLSRDGLPLSVQFVGRYFDEAGVYRVAAAYEQAAGWQARRPPL